MTPAIMLFFVGLFGGLMGTVSIKRRQNGGHRKIEKNEEIESLYF